MITHSHLDIFCCIKWQELAYALQQGRDYRVVVRTLFLLEDMI
jgi:hypothetical protein